MLKRKFSTTKYLDTHLSNTLANSCGKCKQYIHSRGDPFCQSVIAILGLIESRDSVSQDGEDGFGRVAGLKVRKERMGG